MRSVILSTQNEQNSRVNLGCGQSRMRRNETRVDLDRILQDDRYL